MKSSFLPIYNAAEAQSITNAARAKLNDLLIAIGKYAIEHGEDWRTGNGAEIMDAYEAAMNTNPASPTSMYTRSTDPEKRVCPECKHSKMMGEYVCTRYMHVATGKYVSTSIARLHFPCGSEGAEWEFISSR